MEIILYQWVIPESPRQVTPQDREVDIELNSSHSRYDKRRTNYLLLENLKEAHK